MSLSPKAKQSIDYSEGDDFGNVFAEKNWQKNRQKNRQKNGKKTFPPSNFRRKYFQIRCICTLVKKFQNIALRSACLPPPSNFS
jgi:hypothetical protein